VLALEQAAVDLQVLGEEELGCAAEEEELEVELLAPYFDPREVEEKQKMPQQL